MKWPSNVTSTTNGKNSSVNVNHQKWELFDWLCVVAFISLVLLILLVCGLIKAGFLCYCDTIGKWKCHSYTHPQPSSSQTDESKCWKFFVDTISFILLPFIRCWNLKPNKEDLDELSSNIAMKSGNSFSHTDEENVRLIPNNQLKDKCYTNEDSRNNFSILANNCEESHVEGSELYSSEADIFVRRLLAAKVVYRALDRPLGLADVTENQPYSIRGYFIPASGGGYQFFTHNPLRQYWQIISEENGISLQLMEPKLLDSKYFTVNYVNKEEVLAASELSPHPPVSAPCINALVQNLFASSHEDLFQQEIEIKLSPNYFNNID